MARYRKIDTRMWGDAKFRALSSPAISGKYLWIFLLTGPHTTNLPGLFRGGEKSLAEEVGWSVEGFRKGFRELFQEGLIKADWNARVVWIPNAIKYNPPENPNVVKSWRDSWDEVPECPLKSEAYERLKGFTEGLGEGFGKAFRKCCAKGLANQEQEQEQELNTSSERKTYSDQESKEPGKKGTHEESPEASRLAVLLKSEILGNKPDFRITPAQLRKWEQTADRMLRLDGRTEGQIAALIRWAQQDEFWMANILSMDKLREKFDQLSLKASQSTTSSSKPNGKPPLSPSEIARRQQAGEEWRQ
ncbi:MAG TPA: hypothetical protein VKV39_02475 [Candidatus Sulfotelmatobacter sp.]|nr:hypothetical protein [Candidatus Sulfotelmatobacter sp.]